MKLLVTGGAGFIGSNFIRYMLQKYAQCIIVNLDKLTYAGNLDNTKDLETDGRYSFVKGDLCDGMLLSRLMKQHSFSAIINFAAESHVDRSIAGPLIFTETNVTGTHTLLEAARTHDIPKFIQISTDEVYGSLGAVGSFNEASPLCPNSPYSASKAAADMMARAYHQTYSYNICITRCSNNYGPYQFPEKLIPRIIANALAGIDIPVYGHGLHIRDWLHVNDHCSAIELVLLHGSPGEVYNIGGHNERTNIEVIGMILARINKHGANMVHVDDRKGHDERYAIDPAKIMNELGWKPTYSFETGLDETIAWYMNNEQWLTRIMNGEYLKHEKT